MKSNFLSLVFLVVMTAAVGAAVPFTNGSFESLQSPYTPDAHYLINGDTYVTGWVHGGPGSFQSGDFLTEGSAWGIAAANGTYYVGFGAGGVTGGTLSQTFDTVIGVTYFVNYLLTTQEFDAVPPTQVAIVQALNGSTVLASVTNSFNSLANNWFSGLTLAFTATSTSTTLRFTDATSLANTPPVNWGLDNVTVGSVPEPASFGLLALGAGLLGLCARRRR